MPDATDYPFLPKEKTPIEKYGGNLMTKISVDNPIESAKEDLLDRQTSARSVVETILDDLDISKGCVVSIVGKWGSGKTSFVNLMKEEFQEKSVSRIIDFNPWMFSGTQQLTFLFFEEIGKELSLSPETRRIGEKILDYGHAIGAPLLSLIPFTGPAIAGVLNYSQSVRNSEKAAEAEPTQTLKRQRHTIEQELSILDSPVIVVLDDIDRLTISEIKDVFKLVKLTASFPNLVYILPFDRQRVEVALEEDNLPGKEYLEKIVQLKFDLPEIPEELLLTQVYAVLSSLPRDDTIPFDEGRWIDSFAKIILPLIKNFRDAQRWGTSLRPAMKELGDKIDTVDLITLETVRIFEPDLFDELVKLKDTVNRMGVGKTGKQKSESNGI